VLPLSMTGVRGHGPSAEKRGCPFLAHRGQRLPCRTSSTCRSYLHIKNVIDNWGRCNFPSEPNRVRYVIHSPAQIAWFRSNPRGTLHTSAKGYSSVAPTRVYRRTRVSASGKGALDAVGHTQVQVLVGLVSCCLCRHPPAQLKSRL